MQSLVCAEIALRIWLKRGTVFGAEGFSWRVQNAVGKVEQVGGRPETVAKKN